MKITFGIQPRTVERIEAERKRWNEIELAGPLSDIEVDMIYSEAFWNQIAKEFGWHPFALALKYFEHLAGQPSTATPVEGEDLAIKVIVKDGVPYVDDRLCSYETMEIRSEIKELAEVNEEFNLPAKYTYVVTEINGFAKIVKKQPTPVEGELKQFLTFLRDEIRMPILYSNMDSYIEQYQERRPATEPKNNGEEA